MDDTDDDRKELALFGRVMASVSHEFNNVISIIGQVGGLLEDLAAMQDEGREVDPGKWRKQTERILFQTERGKAIVKNMNRFAHSIDEPAKTFDLGAAVQNLAFVAERLVKNRNADLVLEVCDVSAPITSDPFLLRFALLKGLDLCLDQEPPPAEIHIACEEDGERVRIRLSGSDLAPGYEIHPALLDARAAARRLLGECRVESGRGNNGGAFVLELPRRRDTRPVRERRHDP